MDTIDASTTLEEKQWKLLRETGDESARYALIDQYRSLATQIAGKIYSLRTDNEIEFEDYEQYAFLGLIDAVDRYNPDSPASFSTYAGYRIKGSIFNGLEKFSEKREQIGFRKRHLSDRLNSLASLDPDATVKKDVFSELVELTVGMAVAYMLEGSGQVAETKSNQIDLLYENHAIQEIRTALLGYLDQLSEREQLVLRYHYFQQVGFTEIADILGVSKGRVSQIHRTAIFSLKEMYENSFLLDNYY